jgi:hypothetical protein
VTGLMHAPNEHHHQRYRHHPPQGGVQHAQRRSGSYPQAETFCCRATTACVSLGTKTPSAGWRRYEGIRERRHTETARGKPPARGPRQMPILLARNTRAAGHASPAARNTHAAKQKPTTRPASCVGPAPISTQRHQPMSPAVSISRRRSAGVPA